MEILNGRDFLVVTLSQTVLFFTVQSRTKISNTVAKAAREGFNPNLSSNFSLPLVEVFVAGFIVKHRGQVNQFVPRAEPTVACIVSGGVEHCVFFIENVIC